MLPLLIVAIGQTFVLITGGIDLSVTSIIALSSVAGASVISSDQGLLAGHPLAVPVGILVMLLMGATIGLINGAAITKFKMPPFIVTLTMMMFFSGFAIWLTQSKNIYGLPESFIAIGKGSLFIIPYALILALIIGTLAHLILTNTLIGRWIYAIGLNVKTSSISGVPVNRTILFTYVVSGICAAVAAILYTGRIETGSPVLGQKILLDIVGAVVIGGTSLFGGKGKIIWTVFGVLFMVLIENSLNLLNYSYFTIMIIKGLVILMAALLDALRRRFVLA
jgi:ribose/xylose/arabinose/galactoside ABC-type transport system permease subunit